MTPLAAALLLATAQTPGPLPDDKAIDSVTFAVGGEAFPPTGSLTVTAAGKVTYRDRPGLFATSSGGPVTSAEWEIPKNEAAKLLAGLVADGLLDLPSRVKRTDDTRFTVASGPWRMYLTANPVPEKLMTRLRPLLEKADPHRWKLKPAPPAEKPAVTHFEFTFTEPTTGHEVTFGVWRSGTTGYFRKRPATDPQGAKTVVSEVSSLDAAGKILDALVADGLLDLKDAAPDAAARYHVQVFSGKWTIETWPKALPDAVMKHLRPLLEKADPEAWKKP